MSASPQTRSPPPKRLKPDTESSSGTMTKVNEAPVRAMFVPPQSATATATPQPGTSATAGPSQPRTSRPGGTKAKGSKRKIRRNLPEPYSAQDVLWRDIRDFLGEKYVEGVLETRDGSEWSPPEGLELQSIVELRVGAFTVSGESLSLHDPSSRESGVGRWAVVVPFAHPGDLIRARIYKHDRLHSLADLVEIVEYSEATRGGEGDRRNHPHGGCKYFGECGGCQLQPLPYALQLAHKRRTVQLAYARFSALPPSQVPEIGETIPSPKQWGYRTKITPHFDAAPKRIQAEWAKRRADQAVGGDRDEGGAEAEEEDAVNGALAHEAEGMDVVLNGTADSGGVDGPAGAARDPAAEKGWETRIGFERKGRPGVMDIEECPIATPILNARLGPERARIKSTIHTFKRGATLLLRDSLPAPSVPYGPEHTFDPAAPVLPAEEHVAITDHHQAVFERVGDFMFQFEAGSFFQNNNSILVPLVEYVRSAIFPSRTSPASTAGGADRAPRKPTHLVDTYCGSGLFGISLSPAFEAVAGVEISEQSIRAAKRNAEINGLGDKGTWMVGKAEEIFKDLPGRGFEGGRSCVVVDPPRKGCDTLFLTQLLAFQPLTIVYVSCNVHTQARDVGWFLTESEKQGVGYKLESVRGFDLFPQTAHVESVAVLRLSETGQTS